jgi:regulatory protein
MELQRKGVPEPIINEVLEPVDADDERNVARDLVRKKWRSVAGLEPKARRRRLAAILGRRGYSVGLSFEVIREIELENEVDSLDPADNPSLDR